MYVSTIIAKLIIDRLYSSEASLNVGTGRMGKVQNVVQQLDRVRTPMGCRKNKDCVDAFGQYLYAAPCLASM